MNHENSDMNKKFDLIRKAKEIIFKIRLRYVVRIANRDANLFKKRLLVIDFGGVPRVYEKQKLKTLIKTKYFKKGTTIQQLEKMAYHITR